MKHKIFSLILAATLLFTAAFPAYATETEKTETETTESTTTNTEGTSTDSTSSELTLTAESAILNGGHHRKNIVREKQPY